MAEFLEMIEERHFPRSVGHEGRTPGLIARAPSVGHGPAPLRRSAGASGPHVDTHLSPCWFASAAQPADPGYTGRTPHVASWDNAGPPGRNRLQLNRDLPLRSSGR